MEIDGDRLVGGAYFEKFVSWYVVFRPATSEFVQNAQFLNLWGRVFVQVAQRNRF